MKQFLALLFFISASFSVLAAKENNFLVIADIHLDIASHHTMELTPSRANAINDLDIPSFQKLLTLIDDNIKTGKMAQPDFIILLGDLAGHLRWINDSAVQDEISAFKQINETFPHTPILYTFGNNDSLYRNYGVFKDLKQAGVLKSPYDIAKYATGWPNGFLSTGIHCETNSNRFPCLITENTEEGYYSAYLKANFRFIALNSVAFAPRRRGISEQRAMQQLQWFEEQLAAASANKESVLIATHIPPGNNINNGEPFWLQKEQSVFLKILKTYQKSIVGILGAHTHADEIKIIKDTVSQQPIAGIYYTAALSTSHGNAPSIKTFYFSQEATGWNLSNYVAFYVSQEGSQLLLNQLYNYRNYYCPNQESELNQCLGNITADKVDKYYEAGNKEFKGRRIGSAKDIYLWVP